MRCRASTVRHGGIHGSEVPSDLFGGRRGVRLASSSSEEADLADSVTRLARPLVFVPAAATGCGLMQAFQVVHHVHVLANELPACLHTRRSSLPGRLRLFQPHSNS
jgi:hypothetical protein